MFDRIARSIEVMGGKPCIRGTRVTVGVVVGLVAAGKSFDDILQAYPYLHEDDIRQALSYAEIHPDDLEEIYLGQAALEDVRTGRDQVHPLGDILPAYDL